MKRVTLFILSLVVLIPSIAKADCDYKEQNRLGAAASNMKANYTVERKKEKVKAIDSEGSEVTIENEIISFVVNIFNLTEDLYVGVSNNYNSDVKNI